MTEWKMLLLHFRCDADALFHLHKTELRNILDVQVLYCRANQTGRFLHGLAKAFDKYPPPPHPPIKSMHKNKV